MINAADSEVTGGGRLVPAPISSVIFQPAQVRIFL